MLYVITLSIVMDESPTTHINVSENPTDLLTKVLCCGKRRYLVNNILCDEYNGGFKVDTVAQ